MNYVYVLKSKLFNEIYVGHTTDLKQRLKDHNFGKSPHTSKFKPWLVVTYCAFDNAQTAINFEKYLKTGSGRAFIKRHFI